MGAPPVFRHQRYADGARPAPCDEPPEQGARGHVVAWLGIIGVNAVHAARA
ncbi:hypothetical protein ACFYQ5_24115 [Streptomyces sp. NPDC005794]|uniref:hypothetical protein n=1 Tax=Streptomyces sp. NPDC005794 TaxID=3364733 RepID=UPI0036BE2249